MLSEKLNSNSLKQELAPFFVGLTAGFATLGLNEWNKIVALIVGLLSAMALLPVVINRWKPVFRRLFPRRINK